MVTTTKKHDASLSRQDHVLRDTVLDPSLTLRTVRAEFLKQVLERRELVAGCSNSPRFAVCPLHYGSAIPLVSLHILEKARDLKEVRVDVFFVMSKQARKNSGPSASIKHLLRVMGFRSPDIVYASEQEEWFGETHLEMGWRYLRPFMQLRTPDEEHEMQWRFYALGHAFYLAAQRTESEETDADRAGRVLYLTGQNEATWIEAFHKAQRSEAEDSVAIPIPLYGPELRLRRHILAEDTLDEVTQKLSESVDVLTNSRAQFEFLTDMYRYFCLRASRRKGEDIVLSPEMVFGEEVDTTHPEDLVLARCIQKTAKDLCAYMRPFA